MEELKAKVDIERLEGVKPKITKEDWAKQSLIHFKLEPVVVPEWKRPFLPLPPRVDIKPVIKPVEKIWVLDIETTGLRPWNSRIIVIGLKDLKDLKRPEVLFFDLDEEELMKSFVKFIKLIKPTQLVGWNLGFDMKFIFHKLCNYRLELKELQDAKIYDLGDVYRRGTERRIWTFQKLDKLNDVAKALLDREKLLTFRQILNAWKRKDYDLILEHNVNDLQIIADLWILAQWALGKKELLEAIIEEVGVTEGGITGTSVISCPTCLTEISIAKGGEEVICEVCKTKIEGI